MRVCCFEFGVSWDGRLLVNFAGNHGHTPGNALLSVG